MSNRLPHALFAVLALLVPAAGAADPLRAIAPLDSLANIARKVPAAQLRRLDSLSDRAVIYRLAAPALEGVVLVGLADWRSDYRQQLRQSSAAIAARLNHAATRDALARLGATADPTDENALRVMWLNWIPARRLALSDLRSRYGEPDRCAMDRPAAGDRTCEWADRGITASLANDQSIANVQFRFTLREYEQALVERSPLEAPLDPAQRWPAPAS